LQGTKRILCVILLLVMVCALLPAPEASAAKSGYLSLEEAGAQLRDCMAERRTQQTIKVHLEIARPLTNAQIFDCLLKEAIKHTGNGKEGDALRWAWNQTGYLIEDEFDGKDHYITFELYTATYYSTAQQEKELDAKVAQIIQSLNLSGKSDYEKVCAIYDYVCFHVKYADEVYEGGDVPSSDPKYFEFYSAYSALVNGKATCQGFSIAMYRLLLEAGVDNRIVTGTTGAFGHGWNIVKLGDLYYCLDSTWDSDWYPAFGSPVYFLKGASAFGDHKTYRSDASKEFRDRYPIASLDYGAEATATGSGPCGDNATWSLTADGTLTISGSGDLWHLYEMGNGWVDLRGYVKKLVIQSGITGIGIETFYGLQELKEVSIPSTVTCIYDNAFGMCTKLTEITVPNSVETLGSGVFKDCWSLKSVRLPQGLTAISEQLFAGCMALESITIPSSVTSIGTSAFVDCSSLGKITIPNSVTTLGFGAFAGAFDPAKKVSLTIPESVTEVDQACFELSGLREVIWNAKTDSVNYAMFNLCTYLENVVFTDYISKLGEKVLYECVSLKTVKLPGALQEMGWEVMVNCKSLQSVELPNTLTELPQSTFLWCDALENVSIPEGITKIGHSSFEGCKSLKSITFPASVKILEDYLFADSGLQELHFEGNMPEFATFAFGLLTKEYCVAYYPAGDTTWKKAVLDEIVSNNANISFAAQHGPEGPHTLGGEWFTSAEGHWQKCLGCDYVGAVEAHGYDSACDGECNTCGYVRAVTHVFDQQCYDESFHWVACVCGAVANQEAHTWNSGVVTKQPSCKELGTKTYTCTMCSAIKTEDVAKLTEHTYDNACDTSCNVCDEIRTVPHNYQTTWSTNKDSHWYACTLCGNKKDQTAHTPGPAATETTPQTCTICGYVLEAVLGHTHSFSTTYFHDASGHWFACDCGEKKDVAEHGFTNGCDATCDDCGYTRDVTHSFGTAWSSDETHHYHACACGETADKAVHSYGADHFCSVCGFADPNASAPTDPPVDPTEPSTQPSEDPTQPEGEGQEEEKPNGFVWVIVAGVVLVAGGGAAVLVLKKKK